MTTATTYVIETTGVGGERDETMLFLKLRVVPHRAAHSYHYHAICLESGNSNRTVEGEIELLRLARAALGRDEIKDSEELVGATVTMRRLRNGAVEWKSPAGDLAAERFFEAKARADA
jgi:hypothetical protein